MLGIICKLMDILPKKQNKEYTMTLSASLQALDIAFNWNKTAVFYISG